MTSIQTNGAGQITHISLSIWDGTVVYIRSDATKKKYKVTKANPKNIKMIDEDGKPWQINRTALLVHEDQTFDAPPPPPVPVVFLGQVVRFLGADRIKFPGDYVVIGKPRDPNGRYKFARIGGDQDRTVTGGLNGVEIVIV